MPDRAMVAPSTAPQAGLVPQAIPTCVACSKPLRRGAHFCAYCGRPAGQTRSVTPPLAEAKPIVTHSVENEHFAWRWKQLSGVGWLFGLWLLTSLMFGFAARATNSPWLDVAQMLVSALLVLAFAAPRERALAPLFNARAPSARTWRVIVLVSLAMVLAMSAYFALLKSFGIPMLQFSRDYRRAGWPLWSILLMLSIAPAVVEEIGFRGVIQSTLGKVLGVREALLIQAALFSVLHLSPLIFPSHFVMGLCFGYLRCKTRSLYPGMALHGGWNALVLAQELMASAAA